MKRIDKLPLITLVTALLLVAPIATLAATLNWGASSGEVTGYKVYYGTSASSPSSSVDVGKVLQYPLEKLPLKEMTQYYFSVSAYNAAGESGRCTPVAYTPADATPPAPPIGLKAP